MKCYQNQNQNLTKTLSDCPGAANRCVAGKVSLTVTVAPGQEITSTQNTFGCTMDSVCDSYCKIAEAALKQPGMKINSCKTYCCTDDGCNKAAEQSNDGYFFVANAKLVGIVMMFSCVLFSYL